MDVTSEGRRRRRRGGGGGQCMVSWGLSVYGEVRGITCTTTTKSATDRRGSPRGIWGYRHPAIHPSHGRREGYKYT